MTLLPTLWQTVKWKHVLFWYAAITLAFWLGYDTSKGPIAIAIMGQIGMTFIAITIILGVWNRVITGCSEGFPIVWIFSTVVKDVRILPKEDEPQLKQLKKMKNWCQENCNGKWRHCEHGYFVFRKKTDAMAFKLVWYHSEFILIRKI